MNHLPPNTVLANTQQEGTVILDPRTGETIPIGGQSTSVVVDAAGGRHSHAENMLLRGDDLRTINPKEPVFKCCCGCGQNRLTAPSVLYCSRCQDPIRRSHQKTLADKSPICPRCYRPLDRIRKAFTWIKNAL